MRTPVTRLLTCAGLLACIWPAASTTAAPGSCRLQAGPERTVTRILDATALALDDGSVVRLANVLSPQQSDAATDVARASVAALEAIAQGASVRLWFDIARQDRHGTLRAHLTLTAAGEERWLQAVLVESGHVRVDARLGERACVEPLLALEAKARTVPTGLWTLAAFRPRAAEPAREFVVYRGTAQIVYGTVQSVETARDVVRLVLGKDRRRALTVSLRANDRDMLGTLGGDARLVVGRRIEARGYVGTRFGGGPDIDVSLAGDVRLLP